jgi:DAACS family dicarboxylate/amino acid:cation (Na+ or H+) symporter
MSGPLVSRCLRHPLALLIGVGLGLAIALTWPGSPEVAGLAWMGKAYLAALGMTALPIICTGILAGLGTLVRSGLAGRTLPLLAGSFAVLALVAALVGALCGQLLVPGDGGSAMREQLGALVQAGEAPGQGRPAGSAVANIFAAMANGDVLPVVLACILLGLALGGLRHRPAEAVIEAMQALNAALLRVVDWIMLLLPLGLCGVAASLAGAMGLGTLLALLRLLGSFYVGGALLVLLFLVLIRQGTGASWRGMFAELLKPVQVAFLSSSSISAMPLAIRAMGEGLGCDRRMAGLVIPLGLTAGRTSFPLLFALVAVFTAQVYGQEVGPLMLLATVGTAAAVGAVAAAGSPAATAVLYAPVAAVAGLPATPGIAVIVALAVLLDPLVSLLNVLGPSACTAVLHRGAPPCPRTDPPAPA